MSITGQSGPTPTFRDAMKLSSNPLRTAGCMGLLSAIPMAN
jgi:hypothetical protein